MKAFETWKFNGIRFLAIPNSSICNTYIIVDEHGNNYGSWYTIESFRKRQNRGEDIATLSIGKIKLSVKAI